MRAKLEKLLAKRLREVAKQKGIALSHVADRAGVARSYMWLLLDGSSSATLDAVQRLAEALSVEPILLLTQEEAAASSHTQVAAEKRPATPAHGRAKDPRSRRKRPGAGRS